MRALSLGILTIVTSISSLRAQDPSQPPSKGGFVRLVHAVAQGTGPLTMEIDGKSVNKDGYNFGDFTGGIPLKAGSRKVKFTIQGVKDGTTTVSVVPNETTTLIPFAEKVPASDTEPAHWMIRILRLKQRQTESGRSVTFVSVSSQPELSIDVQSYQGNWVNYQVKRLATAQGVLDYPKGYAPLRYKDRKLNAIPIADIGNYVVVLYDDPKGELQCINFRDFKFLSEE